MAATFPRDIHELWLFLLQAMRSLLVDKGVLVTNATANHGCLEDNVSVSFSQVRYLTGTRR